MQEGVILHEAHMGDKDKSRYSKVRAPVELPMFYVCDCCGMLADRSSLRRWAVRTLVEVRCGGADLWAEAEYLQSCGRCGAIESYQSAITCASCLQRPCVCDL